VTAGRAAPGAGRARRSSSPSTARATLYIVLAACGFGSITILTTLVLRAGGTVTTAVVFRFLLAAPLLLLAAGWRAAAGLDGRRRGELLVLGGGGQAAINLVSLSALHYIPAATLVFLFYTYPAWIAVFAAARGTERITRGRAAALLLSLAGIATIIGNPLRGELHPLGVGLSLAAAVIYAAYIPLLDELQRTSGPLGTTAWMSVGTAIFMAIIALSQGDFVVAMHATAWKAVITLALVSTAGAFFMFMKGLQILGSVRTAIVSTVEPFFTALLGAWVLSQPLTRGTLIGGAMIAAAVVLLQLGNRENGRAAS